MIANPSPISGTESTLQPVPDRWRISSCDKRVYEKNAIPGYIYELYTRWVVGDITKWGKQEKILKQMIRASILKQGTAIRWDSLAENARIKSHRTVSSYAEDLENMFVFFVLYYIDLNKKTPDYNKNKKYTFSIRLYSLCSTECSTSGMWK